MSVTNINTLRTDLKQYIAGFLGNPLESKDLKWALYPPENRGKGPSRRSIRFTKIGRLKGKIHEATWDTSFLLASRSTRDAAIKCAEVKARTFIKTTKEELSRFVSDVFSKLNKDFDITSNEQLYDFLSNSLKSIQSSLVSDFPEAVNDLLLNLGSSQHLTTSQLIKQLALLEWTTLPIKKAIIDVLSTLSTKKLVGLEQKVLTPGFFQDVIIAAKLRGVRMRIEAQRISEDPPLPNMRLCWTQKKSAVTMAYFPLINNLPPPAPLFRSYRMPYSLPTPRPPISFVLRVFMNTFYPKLMPIEEGIDKGNLHGPFLSNRYTMYSPRRHPGYNATFKNHYGLGS